MTLVIDDECYGDIGEISKALYLEGAKAQFNQDIKDFRIMLMSGFSIDYILEEINQLVE